VTGPVDRDLRHLTGAARAAADVTVR